MKNYLNQIHPVKDEILEEYTSCWEEYELPRKTIMTNAGDTERYMYFVLEGVQKSYYLHNAKEYVIAFTYPPSFSGIPDSFLTQSPSKYFLETITDSRFLRIPFSEHQRQMEKHREIETLFRKATELFLIGLNQRHFELMAYDIETRFKTFTERSPHLLQMVSNKDIASYLRIDPTNFSKLMNSIKI